MFFAIELRVKEELRIIGLCLWCVTYKAGGGASWSRIGTGRGDTQFVV
jgi:hypothetical protein